MSKIFVKQQRTLQDYGMGRVDEFPTVPYDPSQLAPGIAASINERPTAQEAVKQGTSINNLQDYQNFMYDDYMNYVNANTNPETITDIRDTVENARNNAIRQIANNVGGYDSSAKFQLYPQEGETLTNTVNSNFDEAFGTEGNDKSSRDYYANLVRRYGKDGAAEILINHPNLQTGTQLSLPQVVPGYQTENPFNEDGSIKPGAVPPVTAVKQMNREDIQNLMMGAGLLPVGSNTDADNRGYEEGVIRRLMAAFNPHKGEGGRETLKLSKPFVVDNKTVDGKSGATQAGYFVSPTTKRDIYEAVVASKRGGPKGMIGIRGLNPVDNFVQQRASTGQREGVDEGFVHSRIDPSRLVPIQMPQHTIPNTVIGNLSMSTRENDGLYTEDQRVQQILGGSYANEGLRHGVNSGFFQPDLGPKSLSFQNLFKLINNKDKIKRNIITDSIERNERKLNSLYAHEESLTDGAEKMYEIMGAGYNKEEWMDDYIERNNKQYYIDQTLDNLKTLKHQARNFESDFARAVEQYTKGLKSFNEQLPMLQDVQTNINLDDKTASLIQRPIKPDKDMSLPFAQVLEEPTKDSGIYQTESDLQARDKLNFNLDKHGFPLNEDGSAMSMNDKINLVSDPNLKELAQNIFDNKTKVVDQIKRYNTALPFGSDDVTQRKIKPYEFENFLDTLRDRFASAPGEFNFQENYNRTKAFNKYIEKLKEDYYGRR